MARGAPRQWDVGSLWLGDGGVYPGMGESVGLAGTSPELVQSGLWNDGGAVGDPPFDPYAGAMFEGSVGAYSGGGPGAGVAPVQSGGSSLNGHILAGAVSAIVLAGGVFWWHHSVTNGQHSHSPIRWTLGEIGLVTIAAAAGTPILQVVLTAAGKAMPIFAPLADYVNG